MTASWFESAFDAPYLEVYAHRDAREAEAATRALLQPLGLPGKRVLDLACGAGRWLPVLRRHGANVVGVDLSPQLLQRAAQTLAATPAAAADGIALLRADMRHVPLRSESFDLVLSMFTSFGYFDRQADDLQVLAEANRVLRHRGRLLLDLFNAHVLRQSLVPSSRRQAGGFEVSESRYIDERQQRVIKEIELRQGNEVHRYRECVRLWAADALQAALQVAGFAVEARYGGYDGQSFALATSPRLILQARVDRRSKPTC